MALAQEHANQAAALFKAQLKQTGWKFEYFLAQLALYRTGVQRATFANYLRPITPANTPAKRRNRGFPDDIDLIVAIVRVFVHNAPRESQWAPAQALAFGSAAGQPAERLKRLATLFEGQSAFEVAYLALTIDPATHLLNRARQHLSMLPHPRISEHGPLPAPVFGTLPPLEALFCGRNRELEGFAYALKHTPTIRKVLVGLPGSGKTALVAEFAHRYGRYFLGGVFFLVADTIERLHTELLRLGHDCLHLPAPVATQHPEAQLQAVRQALQQHPPCLLIIDNIDALNAEEVEAVLPLSGECRILMTSRTRSRMVGWYEEELAPLAPRESRDLLLRYCHVPPADWDGRTGEVAQQIVGYLDHLPLALKLIGGYIRAQPEPASESLARIAHDLRNDAVIAHTALSPATPDHANPHAAMDRLLAYLLDQLDANHPIHGAARHLLIVSATFPPGQRIDHRLLQTIAETQVTTEGETVARIAYSNDARKELQQRALLSGTKEYSLHRLLRSYVRTYLDIRPAVIQAVEALWHILVSSQPVAHQEKVEEVAEYEAFLHVLAEDAVRFNLRRAAEICYLLGYYLTRASRHDAALYWNQQGLELALQRYGPAHVITAEAWCRVGIARVLRGELVEARQAYQAMLTIQAAIYPENHWERLIGYQNYAQLLVIDGDYETSPIYARRALQGWLIMRREGDAEKQEKAILSIARCLRILNQNAVGVNKYHRAYRYLDAARRLPIEHKEFMAQICSPMGFLAATMGRYAAAHAHITQAQRLWEDTYADLRDTETGQIVHQNMGEIALAWGYRALCMRNIPEAWRYSKAALELFEATQGARSLEVAEASDQCSECAIHTGAWDEADRYLQWSKANYDLVFPQGNSLKHIGISLRRARIALLRDQLAATHEWCATIIAACTALGRPEQLYALWAVALKGECARRTGQFAVAQTHWQWALPRLRRLLFNHPNLIRLTRQGGMIILNPLDVWPW